MNKDKTKKSKVSPLVGAGLGTVAGGPVGGIAGASIARGVNKERDRYAKKGARSHLGKVGHDAKLGAKSLGLGSAVAGGLAGAALGSTIPVKKKGFLGLGRDKKAENQQRLKNTLSGAGLGALGYGTSEAIKGAGTGALVGATRGFVQDNKTKNKKMKKFNSSTKIIDFAFGIPAKPKKKSNVGLTTGIVNGLLTGRLSGAVGSAAAGAIVDRKIDKEKERFRKEGARTRLGKISNDAKIGAKAAGVTSALQGAYLGARGTQGSIKRKLASAALSSISSGVAGSVSGGITGAGVGTVRGLLQPNKKKKK